jgi:hypothetical protein
MIAMTGARRGASFRPEIAALVENSPQHFVPGSDKA